MKRGVYVSLNCVIGIREFMSNYLETPYEGQRRLSHYEMIDYLRREGKKLPISVNYSKINVEDIIYGRYIVVSEETKNRHKKGKMVIYENPRTLDIPRVMDSLQRCDKDDLREARNKRFIPIGIYENSMGEMIYIDFDEEDEDLMEIEPATAEYDLRDLPTEGVNRQKTYTLTSQRHIKGRKNFYR